jgi:hypothetical protein
MTQSIFELKKNRGNSLTALKDAANKVNGGGERKTDERYWQPTVDKSGNGYAIIRFLDAPVNEDVPFVKLFNHAFQGPGGWFIENSLTTISKPDPVSEFNGELWKSSDDDKGPERTQVRKQKRKLNFISNILVVKDSSAPENEGKVFLYKYGKKIFDKLNKKMNPDIPDVEAFSPFDFWTGANFRLVITKDGKYRSYESSEFAPQTPVSEDDNVIDGIWKSQYSLTAEIAPSVFKTYEELEKQLKRVLSTKRAARPATAEDEDDEQEAPPTNRARSAPTEQSAKASTFNSSDTSDDDDMSYFKTLLSKKD